MSNTSLLQLLEGEVTQAELEAQVDLLEDKGNLAEIPDSWMKIIAKSYDGRAGQNSEIKELAKVKNVSKFRTSIIDGMKEEGLSAIFVKVNGGPFAMIYKKANWTGKKLEYSIVSVDGSKATTQKSNIQRVRTTVRSEYSKKGYYTQYNRKTNWFEAADMPMSTLLPKLQHLIADIVKKEDEDTGTAYENVFKNAESIEVYGITFDQERTATKKERAAGKPVDPERNPRGAMKADLDAAGKKYLQKKTGEVASKLQSEMVEAIDGLKAKIVSMMDEALTGKRPSSNMNAELKVLQDKLAEVSRLASVVADCVKSDGSVELVDRWRGVPEKNWNFKSLIDAVKKKDA
jgi:hypothetical protein